MAKLDKASAYEAGDCRFESCSERHFANCHGRLASHANRQPRRGGRAAEGAPLLREYGPKAHRGFESLPLRQPTVVRIHPLLSALVQSIDLSGYRRTFPCPTAVRINPSQVASIRVNVMQVMRQTERRRVYNKSWVSDCSRRPYAASCRCGRPVVVESAGEPGIAAKARDWCRRRSSACRCISCVGRRRYCSPPRRSQQIGRPAARCLS